MSIEEKIARRAMTSIVMGSIAGLLACASIMVNNVWVVIVALPFTMAQIWAIYLNYKLLKKERDDAIRR